MKWTISRHDDGTISVSAQELNKLQALQLAAAIMEMVGSLPASEKKPAVPPAAELRLGETFMGPVETYTPAPPTAYIPTTSEPKEKRRYRYVKRAKRVPRPARSTA